MTRHITRKLALTPTFREIDMMGVLHNCVYFEWFERGRLMIMDDILSFKEAGELNIAIPVLENHCKYENVVRFGDELTLITRHKICDSYTGKLEFTHELINEKTHVQHALGWCSCGIMDMSTHKLLRAPVEKIWSRYIEIK